MITIDIEARQRKGSPLNTDRFKETYKTKNGIFTFSSPSFSVFDKNLFYLISDAKEIPFEYKYRFRPDYLSFDQYGTIMLWEMLMYVNGVMSLEEFDLTTVIIPNYSAVTTILQDRFVEKTYDEMQEINW